MGFFAKIIDILGPWNWWVLGLLLAAVEVFAPGSFFLWFAIAAILVGAIALTFALSWQVKVVLFVVLSIASVLIGRRIYGQANRAEPEQRLNERLVRQIGRAAVLDTPLQNGDGHIRLDDTLWRVEGPDLAAGTAVTITAVRDGRFVVAPR